MNHTEDLSRFPSAKSARSADLNTLSWSAQPRNQGRLTWRHRWFYLLMTPSLLYFVISKYVPIWNAQIAFKEFKPLLGVTSSPWIGFQHFETFILSKLKHSENHIEGCGLAPIRRLCRTL